MNVVERVVLTISKKAQSKGTWLDLNLESELIEDLKLDIIDVVEVVFEIEKVFKISLNGFWVLIAPTTVGDLYFEVLYRISIKTRR